MVASAAHACAYFKVKGACKHGDVSGCAAGAHDDSKPFETKAIGRDARSKYGGGGKGKRSSQGKGALFARACRNVRRHSPGEGSGR
jgi:hypothetical protein